MINLDYSDVYTLSPEFKELKSLRKKYNYLSDVFDYKESIYNALFSNAPTCIMIIDGQGHCLQVNQKGYELMGVKASNILGRNFIDLWPEEERGVVENAMNRVLKGDWASFKTKKNIHDGRKDIKWKVHLRPIPSDGMIVTAYDITNMTKLEQSLDCHIKSLESISTGITITDTYGTIIYTNAAEAKMHGYTKQELMGEHVSIFSSDKKVYIRSIDEISEYIEWTRETINERKDGSKFPVFLKSVPIRDANGIPTGIISISEDITEKKKKDKELQSYTTKLEEYTAKLIQTQSELKDSSLEIVHVLTMTAEYKDKDTAHHIKRIGSISKYISEMLGMDEAFCQDIEYASAMHDIGKIGIPDAILIKRGALTEDEYNVIKQHTVMGANLLNINTSNNVLILGKEVALNHHEKWDGSGYPAGLKANEIPIAARIVMLADHYDALRSNRPYRNGFTHEETVEIILNGDGRTLPTHFDPKLLEIFIEHQSMFDSMFSLM
jgi:putative two-component system response regulator